MTNATPGGVARSAAGHSSAAARQDRRRVDRCFQILLSASVVLGVAAAACSRPVAAVRWEQEFYAAEHLYLAGEHEAARQRFAALRASASRDQDADEAGLMACETSRRAGSPQVAAACYDALGGDAHDREIRARALLHAAEIRLFEMDRASDGERLLWILVERATDTAAGQRAVDHLYAIARDAPGRVDATVTHMLALARRDPHSELADNLLLRTATLLEARGRPADLRTADAALQAFERDHPESSARVAALMTHARVLGHLGETRREAEVLERVVGDWESSAVFGTYYVPAHKEAALRLVALYRGPLADLDRAERHLHHLVEMIHGQTRIFDIIAQLAEVQEQRGDLLAARATWARLIAVAAERDADMHRFDERVCREIAGAQASDACLTDVHAFGSLPIKEVPRARRELERLDAQLAEVRR